MGHEEAERLLEEMLAGMDGELSPRSPRKRSRADSVGGGASALPYLGPTPKFRENFAEFRMNKLHILQ